MAGFPYALWVVTVLLGVVVFVPLFVVGLIMLKSLSRAFSLAIVFAMGSVAGFVLAALCANWAVGHGIESDTREAMMVAFCSAGAAAGGAIAVWALVRRRNPLT